MTAPSRSRELMAATILAALTCARCSGADLTTLPPLKPAEGLKPFEYIEAPDSLPNYLPGERWGTQGKVITQMQKPLTPAESARHYVMQPGFEARLFAAEPEIVKPIAMAWDERGRLWIAETTDYPNSLRPQGQGNDRIKVCEDTDADGVVDRFTVFAEGLSIPTSLVFANGGLIVASGPDFLFLKDTDGDGKADQRRVLFTGWGTRDTHAGPSNLRWGPDNWIWGVVGYSGFRGVVGGVEHSFGMGFFRFKPDGSALEFIRSSNNNTWGLGFSEEGIVLGSTANGNPSMYMPIPNRYYEAVKGWSAVRVDSIADTSRFRPITTRVRQVDQHDRYTAGAGHALYTARSFPKEYWNRVSFVAEPTGHLLGMFVLEPKGADFVARNAWNFLASDDEWASPIMAEVGPDGALWMIDWYNYIIQHNPTPIGRVTGAGSAYETSLRDKTHGRIYRIVHTGSKPSNQPRLHNATTAQLVAALGSDNLLWRSHAQRLLVERKDGAAAELLADLVKSSRPDGAGLYPAAMHALWTLDGLGMARGGSRPAARAISVGLKHPSAGVRRAAVAVLPRSGAGLDELIRSRLTEDRDAQVRLATFLALAEFEPSDKAGQVISAAVLRGDNASDLWIRDALVAAGARHSRSFLASVLSGGEIPDVGRVVVRQVAAHTASSGSATGETAGWLLDVLRRAPEATVVPVLEGFAAGWPTGVRPGLNDARTVQLKSSAERLGIGARSALLVLAARWGRADILGAELPVVTKHLTAVAESPSEAVAERVSAAGKLVELQDTHATAEALVALLDATAAPALSTGLVNALTASREPVVAQRLLERWTMLSPATRRLVVASLLRKPDWTSALVDAIEGGKLSKGDFPAEQWQRLVRNANPAIASRMARVSTRSPSPDRAKVLAALAPAVSLEGDAVQGKKVFQTLCASCHIVAGEGGKIGPDLTGIGSRAPLEILAEIVDPNRSVESNYKLWSAETVQGDSFSGRLDGESQTSVELLDLAGQRQTIQRKDLKVLRSSDLSIMPEGLVDQLKVEEMAALLAFLRKPATH